MMTFLAILMLLALLASSGGYGYAIMRWGIRDHTYEFPLLAVIGVACLVVLGGILNFIGIAYPAAMHTLLLLGLVFFILSLVFKFKPLAQVGGLLQSNSHKKITRSAYIIPTLLVTVATLFFAVNLLPSSIFNHHDDFLTYMTRPVRMLQIGTLGGNPYELLGIDSLGAQAFLQGFVLAMLPVEYLPGFDAVFCMGLAAFLLLTIAQKFNVSWVYATLAILVFFVINPQSVNVSALYSSVLCILGLFLISILLAERVNEPKIEKPLGMAVLAGSLVAALIAIKITLALFAVIYAIFFCLIIFLVAQNKRRALLISATTGFSAVASLLPWLLLHSSHYVAALSIPTPVATEKFSLPKGNVSGLLTTHDLFYGGSMLSYGIIILVLTTLCVLAIFIRLNSRNFARQLDCLLVCAAACAAAIVTYFLNGALFKPEVAVRYSCPVLVATLPFALLVFFHLPRQLGSLTQVLLKTTALVGAVLVFAFFANTLFDRVVRSYSQRTTIAFPVNKSYLQYNRYKLSGKMQQAIRNIQYQTVAGTKIIALISMPLHLDFARNEIQIMMEPGLVNPWLDMPRNESYVSLARYLKKQGVRYIFWQYDWRGMRKDDEYEVWLNSPFPLYRRLAERNLYIRRMFTSIMERSPLIYNYDGVVLFDLNQIN